MKKIIVLISIISVIILFFLYKHAQKKHYDFNSKVFERDEEIAKIIVNNFESTYNRLYITKGGKEPTLTEIKINLNMLELDEDYPRIEKGILKVKSKNEDVECITETVQPNTKRSISLKCSIRGISYGDKIHSKFVTVNGIGNIEEQNNNKE